MNLPQSYIVNQIYVYCKRPYYNQFSKVYNFECPICHEGKSAGRKRRGYYLLEENRFFCHNCNKGWKEFDWVKLVTGLEAHQIIKEANEFDEPLENILAKESDGSEKARVPTLPHDSVNLCDPLQISYYSDNSVVKDCIQYIASRRLNTAINRPETFYVSLTDFVHKNRLCIPFYNEDKKIVFYQTRAIYKKDEDPAKYLSKVGGDKTVYGIHNIDQSLDYLFIFEGPIDAMFVRNGLAVGGIHLSELQENQLDKFRLFKRIW